MFAESISLLTGWSSWQAATIIHHRTNTTDENQTPDLWQLHVNNSHHQLSAISGQLEKRIFSSKGRVESRSVSGFSSVQQMCNEEKRARITFLDDWLHRHPTEAASENFQTKIKVALLHTRTKCCICNHCCFPPLKLVLWFGRRWTGFGIHYTHFSQDSRIRMGMHVSACINEKNYISGYHTHTHTHTIYNFKMKKVCEFRSL